MFAGGGGSGAIFFLIYYVNLRSLNFPDPPLYAVRSEHEKHTLFTRIKIDLPRFRHSFDYLSSNTESRATRSSE